jgi:ornithine cyclodeaminase
LSDDSLRIADDDIPSRCFVLCLSRESTPMSGSALEVIGIDAIRPLLDRRSVLGAVRQALIWQAQGRVQSPPPLALLFQEPRGDCHVKCAHVRGDPTFVIKVASGFYDNPRSGLPVNNGLILVLDAQTGAPRVLFKDDGWLTAWRTAAATALAAAAMAPGEITAIGILGAGLQASLAIEWLPETLGNHPCIIWAREPQKARQLAASVTTASRPVRSAARVEDLMAACNVVITATPSAAPLFPAHLVRAGTHLVAIGADSPGKQELPCELFARAAQVLTDDHSQCLDHGDFGNAVRAGAIRSDADLMLGALLSGSAVRKRDAEDITIADLTGIAAEDAAIADLFSALMQGGRR